MSGSYFSAIFGKSPVRPLQEHMEKILACVRELSPFTEAVLTRDSEAMLIHHRNIVKMENEADALKKELRMRLPSTLFMPVDRRDVLEVADHAGHGGRQRQGCCGIDHRASDANPRTNGRSITSS